MTQPTSTMTIDKHWTLPFPRSRVYAAWVSSATVIAPATAMRVEPAVGGIYRLEAATPEFTAINQGRFLIVEPERRLRYTWQWQGSDETTEIEVDFSDAADGTAVRLSHVGFTTQDSFDRHDSGWDAYAKGFAEHLVHDRDGG